MSATGANPNVAAVVVVGIEDGWTKIVVDGIAKTGKPVIGFGLDSGVLTRISLASTASLEQGLLDRFHSEPNSAAGTMSWANSASCARSAAAISGRLQGQVLMTPVDGRIVFEVR